MSAARPPLPPFTEETAIQKIRAAEDAWNTRQWRNRSEIFQGRPRIVEFLTRKPIGEAERRFRWDRGGPRPQSIPASPSSASDRGASR